MSKKIGAGSIYETTVYDSGKCVELTQGDKTIYINVEDLQDLIKALGESNE